MRRQIQFMLLVSFLMPLILASQGPRKVFPNDRSRGEGKMWLQWDESQRKGFVWGYVWGLERGYRNGCAALDEGFTSAGTVGLSQETDLSKNPLQQCLSKELVFSKEVTYYVAQTTKFYETYPQDQDLPIQQLFTQLADSNNKTLKQIDSWYQTP